MQRSDYSRLEGAIDGLDLDCIKVRLMKPDRGDPWSREKADRAEVLYKRFLLMSVTDPDSAIVPNDEVDDFWHAHILDTQKYAKDCEGVFGFFLHHFPYFGLRGKEDQDKLQDSFRLTQQKYFERFGERYSLDGRLESKPADCSNSSCGAGSCGPRSSMEHLPANVRNDKYLDSSGRPKMAILELKV